VQLHVVFFGDLAVSAPSATSSVAALVRADATVLRTDLIPAEQTGAIAVYGATPALRATAALRVRAGRFLDAASARLPVVVLGAVAARRRLGVRDGLKWLVGLWLIAAGLLLPSLGAGPFGAFIRQGPLVASLALATVVAVYGAVLYGLAQLLRPVAATIEAAEPGRRRLVRLVGLVGVVVLGGGVAAWQLVENLTRGASSAVSAGLGRGAGRLPAEITPVPEFYTVSKNFFSDPVVDAAPWRLEIGGKVAEPFSLTYEELQALPAVEDYRTLLCISNEVGGDLIGNAHWRGVRLRDLLERAGPAVGAYKVVFTCADDYTDSIRLDKALQPEALVAYQMNGESLTPKHGYPARLLVPGIYGMKNVKWLKKLEVVETDFRGFWQQRGWSDDAIIKTMSRIDTIATASTVGLEPLTIGGVAFAGDRGIQRVEFSVDNGQSWQEAQLRSPLAPYCWVLWSAEWTPPRIGQYTIKARATDQTGVVQTAIVTETLPDGASGLHAVSVRALTT
jgi:DMSO/TMAO reductase YedYZ molybdopterin-dependent catalytic subunit